MGPGTAAFLAVRALSGTAATRVAPIGILASLLAAVCEEAFFRRMLYGRLLRYGAGTAVACSAAAFALVHLPAYGPEAAVVDLDAGLLLGWQRWVTGTWSAPALTHAFANLIQSL